MMLKIIVALFLYQLCNCPPVQGMEGEEDAGSSGVSSAGSSGGSSAGSSGGSSAGSSGGSLSPESSIGSSGANAHNVQIPIRVVGWDHGITCTDETRHALRQEYAAQADQSQTNLITGPVTMKSLCRALSNLFNSTEEGILSELDVDFETLTENDDNFGSKTVFVATNNPGGVLSYSVIVARDCFQRYTPNHTQIFVAKPSVMNERQDTALVVLLCTEFVDNTVRCDVLCYAPIREVPPAAP